MATARGDDSTRRFYEEAAQELLFNIVYQNSGIREHTLTYEFSEKTGGLAKNTFRLALGDFADQEGLLKFIKSSPRLKVKRSDVAITIDVGENTVNEKYNFKYLNTTGVHDGETMAAYREKLLLQACKLIAENGGVNYRDDFGNTPLHYLVALPGISQENPNLIKYLLKAGADPLVVNNDGLNILHILVGRIKAEEVQVKKLRFGKERIDANSWEYGHRKQVLEMLLQNMPNKDTSVRLTTEPGRNHNTIMHEWVLSTEAITMIDGETTQNEIEKEFKIASKLLDLQGNLKIPNEFGLVPLHYASQKSVFQFLLKKGASCRSRNYLDETPFLFILKYYVALALVHSREGTAVEEVKGLVETEDICTRQSLDRAIFVLKQLEELINEHEEVRETVWCSDKDEVSPLEVVLSCARITSGITKAADKRNMNEFQTALADFLFVILKTDNPTKVKQLHETGRNPLHDLFGWKMLHCADEDLIVSCLQALIQYGFDVNAADANGRTPLHLAGLHLQKCGSLVEKCAQILISKGARLDLRDNFGTRVQDLLKVNINSVSVYGKFSVQRKVSLRSSSTHSHIINKLTAASNDVKTVHKFRYLEKFPIGRGTFSSIYPAIKEEIECKFSGTISCRVVALKRIEKAKIAPQEIKKEIQTLLSISTASENIVTYYETTEDESFYYISQELMDGDLEHFIANSKTRKALRRNPATSVKAVRDLINALEFLHREKFLHRDLKPGNVLYTENPSLIFKIADFGLAKNISTLRSMTSIRGSGSMAPGTRCWMAPELVSLQSQKHTEESDVFALGLVLHYLLTLGNHPFVSTTGEQPPHVIEKNIVDMKFHIDESLSSEAKHFIEVMLVKRLPAGRLAKHPFLWSENKKVQFLIATGNQDEAASPGKHVNSDLEKALQDTDIGREVATIPWDARVPVMYLDMITAFKRKGYRTNCILELLRFIRNAYAHEEERKPEVKHQLKDNIFLKKFPTLVLDVYVALHKGKFLSRDIFKEALSMS